MIQSLRKFHYAAHIRPSVCEMKSLFRSRKSALCRAKRPPALARAIIVELLVGVSFTVVARARADMQAVAAELGEALNAAAGGMLEDSSVVCALEYFCSGWILRFWFLNFLESCAEKRRIVLSQ